MSEKMDRKKISFGSPEQMEAQDSKYWKEALVQEKVQTITYLRECFYGLEATTGRLQRVFKIISLEESNLNNLRQTCSAHK